MATVRLQKRRKTGHQPPPMVEGNGLALDTAMYVHGEGGEKILVPVRLDDPPQENVPAESDPDPDSHIHLDIQTAGDVDMSLNSHDPPHKNQFFYMREFVARVDGILQAMQAREALPNSTTCSECSKHIGLWRCDDCIGGKLLCRFCMRQSHSSNPFHRIGRWTGTHFRRAALWEVGVYLILPHQKGGICLNLIWQMQMLEKIQKVKDEDVFNSSEETKATDYS